MSDSRVTVAPVSLWTRHSTTVAGANHRTAAHDRESATLSGSMGRISVRIQKSSMSLPKKDRSEAELF